MPNSSHPLVPFRATPQAEENRFFFNDALAAVAWMNWRHAVVLDCGRAIVITPDVDPVLCRQVLRRSSFEDIKKFYCNRLVWLGKDKDGADVLKPLGQVWLQHPLRRQHRGIVFSPEGNVPSMYNLWQGFSVSPAPGDWSLLQDHIRGVICRGDAAQFEWTYAWLAAAVQHPADPAEVALVLRGNRGTGKGAFARPFAELFAPHCMHISSPRHLLGNFNAHLQDAVVVFADEAFLAGDKQSESTLKMMITEPTIPIERKFRDVITAKNVTHLIAASNNGWVVPAGLDERRFNVLDVGDEHRQDHAYFGAIADQLKYGGLAAMLYDLQHHDYAHVNLRQPPVTDALIDQKLRSLAPHERWWLDLLVAGQILPGHDGWVTEVSRSDLHTAYIRTLSDIGVRSGRATQTELRQQLQHLLPTPFPRDHQRTIYGGRQRVYEFPPLDECRRHFDGLLGQPYPWPASESEETSS